MNSPVAKPPKDADREINVRVLTTSGSYPDRGHEKVSVAEQFEAILKRAANKLKIVDTARWVVKIDNKQVSTSATYLQLGLHGEVKLDWGPAEGGGGAS